MGRTMLVQMAHTHKTFVGHIGVAFQMEEHRHIVLVVGSIEASDIDRGAAKAITEVLCVQGGFSIVGDQVRISLRISGFYRSYLTSHDLRNKGKDPGENEEKTRQRQGHGIRLDWSESDSWKVGQM